MKMDDFLKRAKYSIASREVLFLKKKANEFCRVGERELKIKAGAAGWAVRQESASSAQPAGVQAAERSGQSFAEGQSDSLPVQVHPRDAAGEQTPAELGNEAVI